METIRGGRLLLLLHTPHVRHQRLLHQDSRWFLHWNTVTHDQTEHSVTNLFDSMKPSTFMFRIHEVDLMVGKQLDNQGIKMQYFAFRWLSLMLSQEFSLPDVLTLWDALLTDDSRYSSTSSTSSTSALSIIIILKNWPTDQRLHCNADSYKRLSSSKRLCFQHENVTGGIFAY